MVVLAFNVPTTPTATTTKGHFSDVAQGSPFYSYVEAAYTRGIIAGYSDGTFRPDSAVTRGQVAKVVVLASGLDMKQAGSSKAHFSDVATTSAYYSYIEAAYSHNILSGYSDGTFRPDMPATRGQIAKIVVLASQGISGAEAKVRILAEPQPQGASSNAGTGANVKTSAGVTLPPKPGSAPTPGADVPNLPKHSTLPFAPTNPPGTKAGGKGSSTNSNIHPNGPGGPGLANALSTVVYLHTDQLGSVGAVTDASGNVVSRTEYDPWGKVRAQSGPAQTTRNYTGQKLDSTGLLYYNARYYDPSVILLAKHYIARSSGAITPLPLSNKSYIFRSKD